MTYANAHTTIIRASSILAVVVFLCLVQIYTPAAPCPFAEAIPVNPFLRLSYAGDSLRASRSSLPAPLIAALSFEAAS